MSLSSALLSALFSFLVVASSNAAAQVECVGADPEALGWLQKMAHGMHQHSYNGVVTLQRGDEMHVMQVSHRVDGEASTERLTQLTGQGAQVDRVGHPLACVHPGHQLLQVKLDMQQGDCGLAEHYQFSVMGNERVAGRASVRIRVQPQDMYRYGYRIALDRKTGLLLKAETVGRGGKVLEKYQYANLAYGEERSGPMEVAVVHTAGHPHPDHKSLAAPVSRGWAVNWLPEGFSPTDSPLPVSARRSYTDGLAVFSVFLENFEQEIRPGEGVIQQGGTTSYTRGMTLSGIPVLVTVLGEIPVNTARMVADSIAWMP